MTVSLTPLVVNDLLSVSLASSDADTVDQPLAGTSGGVLAALMVIAVLVVTAIAKALVVLVRLIRQVLQILAVLGAALALIVTLGMGLLSGGDPGGGRRAPAPSPSIPPMGPLLPGPSR